MKKLWWLLPVALLAAGSLVFLGCPNGDDDDDDFVQLNSNGPFTVTGWGSNLPTIGDDGSVAIKVANGTAPKDDQSTGFSISFADIGYTYRAQDVLVFTYKVDITTPAAIIVAKNPSNWSGDLANGANWGIGKGREYWLGDATNSVYDGPAVEGTWDATEEEGTFEVSMKFLGSATGIGFQHNAYADTNGDGNRVALNSEYKVTITKISNRNASGSSTPGDPDNPNDGEFDLDALNALEGGLTLEKEWGAVTWDDTNKVMELTDGGNGVFFIPVESGFDVQDKKVTITYACVIEAGNAKIILKQGPKDGDNWADASGNSVNQYPELSAGKDKTLVIDGGYTTHPVGDKIPIQGNSNGNATGHWYIKILKIEAE